MPVGKMDFTQSLLDKTIDFINFLQSKNIAFSSVDFRYSALYKRDNTKMQTISAKNLSQSIEVLIANY